MSANRYLSGYEPENSKTSGGSYTPDNSQKFLEELKEALQQKTDEDIKFRRMLEDLLNNLDFDNMPAVEGYLNQLRKETENTLAAINIEVDANRALIELITQWKSGTDSALATLRLQSDANGAQIQLLTQWKGEAVNSIAQIKMQSDANESSISSIVQWQGTTNTAIASVTQKANANEASISSIAQWQGQTSSSISAIEQRVTANEASIDSITIWRGTASSSIASIQQKANANESSIVSLTQWKGTVDSNLGVLGSNYTQISQQTTNNSATISFITSSNLFTNNGNGTSSANASIILATFTDYNYQTGKYQLKSNISLAADTIDLTGYVTFTNLRNSGQSVINGGNLLNDSVSTDKLEFNGSGGIDFWRGIDFIGTNGYIQNANVISMKSGGYINTDSVNRLTSLSFSNGPRLETYGENRLRFSSIVDLYVNTNVVLHAGNYQNYIGTAKFG